ncbi:hypothetical protein C7999DRAFT_29183 [Corynascus novoguineensis]|uniref:Uncharacterized protein n=1 Tax=Corynascus novoguineensis TaxID=1126955 RepID=A0AAN7CYE5_9PEZI|nr:hypothetical protein C7999DRAFT_29183 [Corynascus novoguineensis]
MDISNKPYPPRPAAAESADGDTADTASSQPAFSSRRGEKEGSSQAQGSSLHIHERLPSSSSDLPTSETASSSVDTSKPSRASFPISFPPIFLKRGKVPSASLASSTAEGKPIPLADPADAHRVSALQKLNSKYPSAAQRHGYAPEASRAQNSTYSQPVLVRTYSGPPPSQGSRSSRSRQYRPPSSSRGVSRRVPLPSASAPGSGGPGQPIQPTVSDVGVGTTSSAGVSIDRQSTGTDAGNAYRVNMPPSNKFSKTATTSTTTTSKLPLPWPWPLSSRQEPEKPKLPPLEAFSFKSFLADLEAQGTDSDISADLDRIAEICARSRYSLSNQYEVHVAPHGSGASFMSGPLPSSVSRTRKGHSHSRTRSHGQGPTLQAITSDDENSARLSNQRRRNVTGKRRSTAYGTLETIMSSSRSSEEDKAKKKSAAELVGEVRGRAARQAWDNNPSASTSGSSSTGNLTSPATSSEQQHSQQEPNPTIPDTTGANPNKERNKNKVARKKSASFATAIMDTSCSRSVAGQTTTTMTSGSPSASSSYRYQTKTKDKNEPASALLSEPAWPQTSGSHLGVRTAATPRSAVPVFLGREEGEDYGRSGPVLGLGVGTDTGYGGAVTGGGSGTSNGSGAAAAAGNGAGTGNSWGAWIPWRMTSPATQQHEKNNAEGRLRQLLRNGGDGATR